MLHLLAVLRVRILDEEQYPVEDVARAFINLNTPEALAAAQTRRM